MMELLWNQPSQRVLKKKKVLLQSLFNNSRKGSSRRRKGIFGEPREDSLRGIPPI